jgi:nicotinamidase-related amidase
MKKLLFVLDMQKDFVDGALGTKEAVAIVPAVCQKIHGWDGDIIATLDTHEDNYMETREGKYLPVPHCINGTEGHNLDKYVMAALVNAEDNGCKTKILMKPTFGSTALPDIIRGEKYDYIEFCGLCTDICVVSNALMVKAHYPDINIAVDANCCAGVTPETHNAALTTMKMCQIDVLNFEN